jgi:DNA-binding SARP family transcriptional activator
MDNLVPRLSIRLLGIPEILFDGALLGLNHLKARALLFFLAAGGERCGRDYLASLLWSETATSEAHHSLRSAIYRLRQAIEPDRTGQVLIGDGELLYLQSGAYESDANEFRRLLANGSEDALKQAVGLYRGPFLQGFSVSNALGFEEWVQSQDTQLSRACFEALDQLAALAEGRTEWMAASHYVEQMIQIDPLAEAAQQRLMRLQLGQGQVSSAVRQYRQFESKLRQELNLAPAPETRALLYDALRQQRSALSPPAAPRHRSTRRQHVLPFIGREDLLNRLTEMSLMAQASQGATVLVEGEGGIGKTRLLEELASQLINGSPPWMVLQGACSPFDDLRSQGPFLEALENGMAGDLNELLALSEGSLPDARGQFFWRVLQLIRALSSSVPLLLVIEDLQWANSSTLNLFGFLTMRLHHLPVMLVGTVQQAEAIPALQRLISLERHRGQLSLLNLSPLKLEDVTDILRISGIHSGLVETFAAWLLARSTGSPFLLTEILAQMRAEGILQAAGGSWQLDTTHWLQWRTGFVLPETTHDLVAWRLANLSPEARHILDVLAVAGQPLSEAVLREFPGVEADALPTLVDDLATRGLIAETSGTLLALPHHLLRETLLHRLSNLRRRSIYRQLAESLEHRAALESESPQQQASQERLRLRQIALYAVAGEDVDRSREYGLRALSEIPQEYAGAESIDFVQHLNDLLAPSASAGEMVRLTRTLGVLHQSVGHLEIAAQWHQQNLEWARKAGDKDAQAEGYFEMAELALMSNDYHRALESAREGLSRIEPAASSNLGSPMIQPLAGRGHRLLGAAFGMEGSNLYAAEHHLQEAMAIHRHIGNQGDLCAALFELGNIAAQRGELQRALNLYDESAQAAASGGIHYYLALARNNFAYHSLLLGRINEARQSVAQGLKVAEAYGLLAALLHLYSTNGEIHLYLAEWEMAEESFLRGMAISEELSSLERQAGYRGGLALAARGRKDLSRAVRLLEEALALIADQGYWHLRTRLQIWLSECLFQQLQVGQARKLIEEAVATAQAHQRTLLLVQGECVHARLLAEEGDWAAANALFTNTLEKALSLDLPLEVARVQAAWGLAALHHSPTPDEGRTLLSGARTVLTDHDARADLAQLP